MKIACMTDGWDKKTLSIDEVVERVIARSTYNTGELERLRAHLDKTTELVIELYKLLPAETIVGLLNKCHDEPLFLESDE